MSRPEHPTHFSTEEQRAQLIKALADIVVFNSESGGVGGLPPNPAAQRSDIFDELPPSAVVLGGEVGISDKHPWNAFILTQVASPFRGDSGRDIEYTLRTKAHGSAPSTTDIYRSASFRVCAHQGHFKPAGYKDEYEMRPAAYNYASTLLIGATFDSEIRTRRALKQLQQEGVIENILHKPRINWLAAFFRNFRHCAPPPPF